MSIYEIKNNIYWVGAVDWELRNFHGYSTHKGSTYNAYLIVDEKVVLIDTVLESFSNVMIDNIKKIIDPSKIDIIICNHVEPDHSGAIKTMLEYNPNIQIYTSSPAGAKGLELHYGKLPLVQVKNGDSLKIGKRTLQFIQTPMIHWPDNMVTYLPEDQILFSNDAFGQHYASSERMDYQCDMNVVMHEARKYYANIVLPYSSQVKRALEGISSLDIDIIAPGHGIIWKRHIAQILEFYNNVVNYTKENKAVIVYDTMWGNTHKIASAIADAFNMKGVSVKLMSLSANHISDIMTEIMDCRYLAIGSSTLNNNILPSISAFLTYLKGLNPRNLKYIAFGSYGWSGQGASIIHDELESMKHFPMIDKINIQYAPSKEQLNDVIKLILSRLDQKDIKLIKEA